MTCFRGLGRCICRCGSFRPRRFVSFRTGRAARFVLGGLRRRILLRRVHPRPHRDVFGAIRLHLHHVARWWHYAAIAVLRAAACDRRRRKRGAPRGLGGERGVDVVGEGGHCRERRREVD